MKAREFARLTTCTDLRVNSSDYRKLFPKGTLLRVLTRLSGGWAYCVVDASPEHGAWKPIWMFERLSLLEVLVLEIGD